MFKLPSYKDITWDVIIIGAGISGYTAAFNLVEKVPNLDLLILEENARSGGRTYTVNVFGANDEFINYDMGGQWVCRQQTELFDLISKLGLEVINTWDGKGLTIVDYAGHLYYNTQSNMMTMCNYKEHRQLMGFVRNIEKLCSKLRITELLLDSAFQDLEDVDMESFINSCVSSAKVKSILHHNILTYCGAEPCDVSLLFYVAFCKSTYGIVNQLMQIPEGLHECWIKNGATEICNKIDELLQETVTVKRESVTEITTAKRYVKVHTERKDAHAAILAISPQDFQEIVFMPPIADSLPDVSLGALKNRMVKFVATYKQEFWKQRGYSGDIYVLRKEYVEDSLHICHNVSLEGAPALTGYLILGKTCSRMDIRHRLAVLNQLALYFGKEALDPIDYDDMIWNNNSILTCSVELMDKYKSIQRTRHRLFFAGAETSIKWYGLMAGAVESGKRAAIETLYSIRPGVLTVADIQFVARQENPRWEVPTRVATTTWTEALFIYPKTYLMPILVLIGLYYIKIKYMNT